MSKLEATPRIRLKFLDFKLCIIFLICYNSLIVVFEEITRVEYNDFRQFYYSAVEFLRNGFTHIYDFDYFSSNYYVSPARYLPVFIILMVGLTFLGYLPALSTFTAFLLVCDMISLYTLIKILNNLGVVNAKNKKLIILFVSIFFITCCMWVYGVSQVSSIVFMIMILSLNDFLNGHEYRGTVLLGISISIKPVSVFVAFFIMVYFRDRLKFKIKHAIAFALALLPDVAVFLWNPFLIRQYIDLNTVRTQHWLSQRAVSFPMLFNLVNIDATIPMLIIVMAVSIVIFWKKKALSGNQRIVLCFSAGMGGYAMMQADFWPSQLIYVFSFIIVYYFTFFDENTRNQRPRRFKVFSFATIIYLAAAVAPTPLFTIYDGLLLFSLGIIQILVTTACLLIIFGVIITTNMNLKKNKQEEIQTTQSTSIN